MNKTIDLRVGSKDLTDLARLNALYCLGEKNHGSATSDVVIAENLFGFNDVVGFKMLSEKNQYIGATIYHKTARVVAFIGKSKKPIFKDEIKRDTVYFCSIK